MRDLSNLPKQEVNFCFFRGGLGDSICRVVPMKYILETHKHVYAHLFVPDYFVDFAKFTLSDYLDKRLSVYGYEKAMKNEGKFIERPQTKEFFNPRLPDVVPGNVTDYVNHTTMRTHLVDHAFHTLADEQPRSISAKNYIKISDEKLKLVDIEKFKLPSKYVVITTGYTSAVREWPASEINKVITFLRARGIEIVFLGREAILDPNSPYGHIHSKFKGAEIQYNEGLNLINKTTLQEALKIMRYSACVIGVDNGLLHLAAMSDVPIIAGYTTVAPEHRAPYRHDQLGWNTFIIGPDSGCSYCQTHMSFVYEADARYCWYGDRKCVTDMRGERFIEGAKWALKLL